MLIYWRVDQNHSEVIGFNAHESSTSLWGSSSQQSDWTSKPAIFDAIFSGPDVSTEPTLFVQTELPTGNDEQFANLKMAIEIVSVPIKNDKHGDFP